MSAGTSSLPPATMSVFREPPGVHMVAAEHMDDLVRDDTQPLLSHGLRRIHPDPARDALDDQRHVRVSGGYESVARLRKPNGFVDHGFVRPFCLRRESDQDLTVRRAGSTG